jgi:L-amino acid N-acyltransferase YncA
MRIRALRRGEHEPVRTVFDGLSAHSRYQRFHGPTPKLTASMKRLLTDVAGARHIALVAEVEGPRGWLPVGIARLIATGDGVAEVAYEVVDEWHNRGIGRHMLTELRRHAAVHGYRTIVALVLPDNRSATALFRSVFPTVTQRRMYGVYELTAHMPPAALQDHAGSAVAGTAASA